jgi:hypothetical protein
MSYVTQLELLGGGNLSEGIRGLVELARLPSGEFWYRRAADDPDGARAL